jgi:hypothetical protein
MERGEKKKIEIYPERTERNEKVKFLFVLKRKTKKKKIDRKTKKNLFLMSPIITATETEKIFS